MLTKFQALVLIIFIFTLLFGISVVYTNKLEKYKTENNSHLMQNYMGIIYIIFGFLKLYNLPNFVNIFSKYDIISKNIRWYGYIYPFIEIILGINLLIKFAIPKSMIATILLMSVSIISVFLSMYKGQKLNCGCLGSFFHIPLSYVTVSENLVMLIMALRYFKNS